VLAQLNDRIDEIRLLLAERQTKQQEVEAAS
jgi:hypothetical protein